MTVNDVGLAVKKLQWLHHRTASVRLAALGLSLPQWDVLRNLSLQDDVSLHDLAQLTFQTDQSMGALAARMVRAGLIERVPGPGRAVRHQLTADGRRLYEQGRPVFEGVLDESLGVLTPRQLATLHRLLSTAYARTPSA